MLQALADHLHRDAGLEKDPRMRVPEIVETNPRQRRLLHVTVEDLAEQVWMCWLALSSREDDPVLVARQPAGESLLELSGSGEPPPRRAARRTIRHDAQPGLPFEEEGA